MYKSRSIFHLIHTLYFFLTLFTYIFSNRGGFIDYAKAPAISCPVLVCPPTISANLTNNTVNLFRFKLQKQKTCSLTSFLSYYVRNRRRKLSTKGISTRTKCIINLMQVGSKEVAQLKVDQGQKALRRLEVPFSCSKLSRRDLENSKIRVKQFNIRSIHRFKLLRLPTVIIRSTLRVGRLKPPKKQNANSNSIKFDINLTNYE